MAAKLKERGIGYICTVDIEEILDSIIFKNYRQLIDFIKIEIGVLMAEHSLRSAARQRLLRKLDKFYENEEYEKINYCLNKNITHDYSFIHFEEGFLNSWDMVFDEYIQVTRGIKRY